ncbi:MAG: hypothetical protein ACE5NM_09055 [Sedimentisphaerales bacterium]
MNHASDFSKTNPNKANFQTTEVRRQKLILSEVEGTEDIFS